MKTRFSFLIGAIIAIVLICYMITYQVRYNEQAIVTRFDKISENSLKETGFHMRLPWPIDKVTPYTTQIQVLEGQPEEHQTKDGKAVIVRTYLAWRISDPLAFFKAKLESAEEGEKKLQPLLREIGSVISAYDFNQMVNTDASMLKLTQIENEAKVKLEKQVATHQYGMTIEQVGIRRILLPESVTENVFDTMRKTRETLAAKAQDEGNARAAAIISEAESAKNRILAFASRTAEDIRATGDAEASSHYAVFQQNAEFAILLRKIAALKTMLKNNTTFVLDANSVDVLQWFNQDPTLSAPGSKK